MGSPLFPPHAYHDLQSHEGRVGRGSQPTSSVRTLGGPDADVNVAPRQVRVVQRDHARVRLRGVREVYEAEAAWEARHLVLCGDALYTYEHITIEFQGVLCPCQTLRPIGAGPYRAAQGQRAAAPCRKSWPDTALLHNFAVDNTLDFVH